MEKGTNAAVFPNAELIVSSTEYNWWTEPGRVEKLPEGRRPAGKRIADVFPTWKNWKLVEDNAEVAPGVRMLAAPGHTPGHSAFLVTSGKDQLMVSNDTDVCAGAAGAASGLAGRLRPGRRHRRSRPAAS